MRRLSEANHAVHLTLFKSLDSSFRWNDVVLAFSQKPRKLSLDSSGPSPKRFTIAKLVNDDPP
jgi:hypothetical protein